MSETRPRARGARNTSWLILNRGLAIVRRLMRGPATKGELLDAVRKHVGPDAYSESAAAAEHALKNDRVALKNYLEIAITYDRRLGQYRLESLGDTPWLDLDDDGLAAIATIYATFAGGGPEARRVCAFLDRIAGLLPPERLADIRRPALSIELRELDERPAPQRILETVQKSIRERHRLGFRYSAGAAGEREPRYHEVEPYAIVFRDGHYYLDCFDLYSRSERHEPVPQNKHRTFRVQGILDDDMLRVLPERLPPGRRPQRCYRVRYRLAPPAVHHGVSHHFADMQVEKLADGSAIVEGATYDPWDAARTLLHYGDSCTVLGGDEVLREMRKIVAAMAKNYDLLVYEPM